MRYQPIRPLGRGGMGEVALAEDRDIGRNVAIKYLRPEMSREAAVVVRFAEEIRAVGALDHPNVVPIHDVGKDDDGRLYFVMKHVDGDTLEHVIERIDAGDPAYAEFQSFEARVQIFLGVLHALAFAHAKGLVHRDVKPANVMIGRFGEVVLMDWGIAKRRGSDEAPVLPKRGEAFRIFETTEGTLLGTPAYMCPEQARGDVNAVDARSDLYSACVLFHELLALRHYLHEETTAERVLAAITTREIDYDALQRRDHPWQTLIPAELVHFLVRGLSKNPAARFASANAMIERLNETLAGQIHVQCKMTFTKRALRDAGHLLDRRPALGLGGLGALVVFAIAGVALTVAMLVRAAL